MEGSPQDVMGRYVVGRGRIYGKGGAASRLNFARDLEAREIVLIFALAKH